MREKIPFTIPQEEMARRRDLRDLPMVTIDGKMPRIWMMQFPWKFYQMAFIV